LKTFTTLSSCLGVETHALKILVRNCKFDLI
jgi:hypothetical protein